MKELVDLGWDGAKYFSKESKSNVNGLWCPFILGYDSDSKDEYEPIDIEYSTKQGVVW